MPEQFPIDTATGKQWNGSIDYFPVFTLFFRSFKGYDIPTLPSGDFLAEIASPPRDNNQFYQPARNLPGSNGVTGAGMGVLTGKKMDIPAITLS